MRIDPEYIAWKLQSGPSTDLEQIQELLHKRTSLDAVQVFMRTSSPGGVRKTEEIPYRIGDYFQHIEISPLENDAAALRIMFHRRPDAGRLWKDLMVKILRSAQEAGANVELERVPEWENEHFSA